MPCGIRCEGTRVLIDGCDVGAGELDTPFFDQAIQRTLQQRPAARRSITLDALAEVAAGHAPAGFVFHVSRCGSTLISRLLASVRGSTMLAEPDVLEALLRGRYRNGTVTQDEKALLLRGLLGAFAAAGADRTFVKWTARACHDHALIRRVFADVPCVFVYRDPVEVVVALLGNQQDRLPPGLSQAGLLMEEPDMVQAMRPVEFWTRVVARQLEAGLAMCAAAPTLLVEYRDLPQMWTGIAKFFGIELAAADIEHMRQTATRSAKDPQKIFHDDRAAKRAAADDELHALVDRFARPHYVRLEATRLAASHSA